MISFARNQDVFPVPLKGAGGDNPTWTASGSMTFDLDDLPTLLDGNLAVYVAGILLDYTLSVDLSGVGAANVMGRHLTRCLISNAQIDGTWHGTPVSANHISGARLPAVEWASCGFRTFGASNLEYVAGEAAYVGTRHAVFIPLMAGNLLKSHHTALPAALYKNGTVRIQNAAGLSLIDAQNTQATVSCRAYALCFAQDEVYLGPAAEWVGYESNVQSSGEAIELRNFGRHTGLMGTEDGAGLLGLYWLDNNALQGWGGAGTVASITRISIPWRYPVPLLNAMPLVRRMEAMSGVRFSDEQLTNDLGASLYHGPFPYQTGATAGAGVTAANAHWPMILPLVMAPPEQELTKVQGIDGSRTIYMAGTFSGTHVLMLQQIRQWTPSAFEAAKQELDRYGIPQAVIGARASECEWVSKTARKNGGGLNPRKERWLPNKLVPRAALG